MMEKHKKTSLLPPSTAVRMVWACTGTFTREGHSKFYTSLVDEAMKDIKSPLRKKGNENKNPEEIEQIENEKKYLTRAKAAMSACLRSIHTIYSGRNLNFDENEKLRETYLESVKESIDFGRKVKDLLASLPTMTIGGIGGATVAQYFKESIEESLEKSFEESLKKIPNGSLGELLRGVIEKLLEDPRIFLLILVVFGIVIGYLINDLVIVRWTRKRKQMLYVIHDYERNTYYENYLNHVRDLLESLYQDLNQIHEEVFKHSYYTEEKKKGNEKEKDGEEGNISKAVKDLIDSTWPRRCEYIHKHMGEKKITPGVWLLCETGHEEGLKRCPHWRYEKNNKDTRSPENNKMTSNQVKWYKLRTHLEKIWYIGLEY